MAVLSPQLHSSDSEILVELRVSVARLEERQKIMYHELCGNGSPGRIGRMERDIMKLKMAYKKLVGFGSGVVGMLCLIGYLLRAWLW